MSPQRARVILEKAGWKVTYMMAIDGVSPARWAKPGGKVAVYEPEIWTDFITPEFWILEIIADDLLEYWTLSSIRGSDDRRVYNSIASLHGQDIAQSLDDFKESAMINMFERYGEARGWFDQVPEVISDG